MKTQKTFLILAFVITSLSFAQTNTLPTSGNVGIGTMTPVTTLNLKGSYSSTSTKGIFAIESPDTYSSTYFGINNQSPFAPFLQSASRVDNIPRDLLINPRGGKVGIGTEMPGAKLDVYTNLATPGIYDSQVWSTNNAGYNLKLKSISSTSGINQQFVQRYNGVDYNSLTFYNGNVGIGTEMPSAKLEVAGDTKINGVLNILGNNALNFSNYGGGFYMQDDSWIRTFGNKNFYHSIGIMRTDGTFQVGPNGDRLVVNTNGNVGIGTTNPLGKLDVNGAVFVKGKSILDSDGTSSYFQSGAASYFQNMGNVSAMITAGGNFGIGTTNPDQKLTVNGNIHTIVPGSANQIDAMTIDVTSFGTSANANASSYFKVRDIGASNYVPFIIKGDGNVGIGTTNPDEKLTVNGTIHATEVKVTTTVPADYVFQKYYTGKSELKSDYAMPSLAEIESFTKENNHLPNVPSAKEMQLKGVSLGEMSNVLLQKVEELTLYAIEQNKELERLKKENENYKSLAERLSALEKELKK